MHPNPAFREEGESLHIAQVLRAGLVHVFAATPDGPMVAHVPLVGNTETGTLDFHLSRGNRIARHLDGADVVLSSMTCDAYISPDWYATTRNQVPTWDYWSVEIEGRCHERPADEVRAHLDELSRVREGRLHPKPPWTTAKVEAPVLEAMIEGVRLFAVDVLDILGTRKFSQNKSREDRAGVRDALVALGRDDVARLIPQ